MEIQPGNFSISIDQAVRQMQTGGKGAGEEGKARTSDEMVEMGRKFQELVYRTDISVNKVGRQVPREGKGVASVAEEYLEFVKKLSPEFLKQLFLEMHVKLLMGEERTEMADIEKEEAIKQAYGQEMTRGSCSSERPSEFQFKSKEVSKEDEVNMAMKEAIAAHMCRVRKFQDEERRRSRSGWLIPFQPQEKLKVKEINEETAELAESTKKEMDQEERLFAEYRRGWEWEAKATPSRGSFQDRTTLSPMQFTHWTSKQLRCLNGTTASALQIYSIKIACIKCKSLNWPLRVYGEVAVRDRVDCNRNVLFSRCRSSCQELTIEDPFLHLIGPSRAIMAEGPVVFEVQLKVTGRTKSQDSVLMNRTHQYYGCYTGRPATAIFDNCRCTAEISFEKLSATVQATILSVRIVEDRDEDDPCTFKYGGRVTCFSPLCEIALMNTQGTVEEVIDDPARPVVLLDWHDLDGTGEMPMSSDASLLLSRRVVSVQLRKSYPADFKYEESLKVVVQGYSQSGNVAAQGYVKFRPKLHNISQDVCAVGDSMVEITVAWSALVSSKTFLL